MAVPLAQGEQVVAAASLKEPGKQAAHTTSLVGVQLVSTALPASHNEQAWQGARPVTLLKSTPSVQREAALTQARPMGSQAKPERQRHDVKSMELGSELAGQLVQALALTDTSKVPTGH